MLAGCYMTVAECLGCTGRTVRLKLRDTRELSLSVDAAENCPHEPSALPRAHEGWDNSPVHFSPNVSPDHRTCMSLPLGPIPLPVSRLSIQLLQWGPQPSTQPSPMTPLASPYIRIGSGCPSPLLSASWLPCCSLRIPGASRWPGGFLRVTLNCSGRRGSRGQNSMLNVILHTASLTQQEQMTEGQKKEVGRHPVSADPVHPGYSQGTLGPWELPQTIFVFLEAKCCLSNSEPCSEWAVSCSDAKSHEGKGHLSLNLLKGKRSLLRPEPQTGAGIELPL